MKKRRWVPKVLWKLFGSNASTLAETIISLTPPECHCKGRIKCLRCVYGGAEDAMSYLFRPDDPSDYHKLLGDCYVFVPENAPPLPPDAVYFSHHWSQYQIVKRTIKTILAEQPGSSNVICSGYNQNEDSSHIMRLLTSSAWDQLLRRVGDGIMLYLLMHTLIFLPHPYDKHRQVAGPPVSLFVGSPRHTSEVDPQGLLFTQQGNQKKRRRISGENSKCQELQCGVSFQGNMIPISGSDKRDANEEKPGKKRNINIGMHPKLPTPELHKKCKKLALHDANVHKSSTVILNGQDGLDCTCYNDLISLQNQPGDKVHAAKDYKENQVVPELKFDREKFRTCPCCSVFYNSIKVPKGAQINRQSMLYSLECSSFPFPKKHILSYLKPNVAGAKYLLKDIFGLSSVDVRPQSISCLDSSGICLHGSSCLYHCLVKMLKVFLRRAKCCQHVRLLDKHCSVPHSSHHAAGDTGTILKGNPIKGRVVDKQMVGNQLNVNAPLEGPYDSESGNCKKSLEFINHEVGADKSFCSKDKVASFIWAACRSMIPVDLLGMPSNWRILRRTISRFIKLRQREKFSLKQCMDKLKICMFPLLSNNFSSCYLNGHVPKDKARHARDAFKGQNDISNSISIVKHNLFERWIFWFFSYVVVPLVQANFYVTESEHGKQNLCYYRKSVWMELISKAATCLKDQRYCALDDASVKEILSYRPFGFSKVRLRPKKNGTRMIVNLKGLSGIGMQNSSVCGQLLGVHKDVQSHPTCTKVSNLKSANFILRDLHAVLKDLREMEPQKWGSSVFDYNEVYKKVHPFLLNINGGSRAMPAVFIVTSDVQKAFDTVNQDKLLSIINEILISDEYILHKACEVTCRKNSLCVYEKKKLLGQQSGSEFESATSCTSQQSHAVIIDQGLRRTIMKEELQFYLTEHVKHNVLQLGQSFFLQSVGIPQGSILSSLLCSLYYGNLERNVIFPFLEKVCASDVPLEDTDDGKSTGLKASKRVAFSSPRYILLRFIDDFLFISTSKKLATCFFSRLQRGFREYNCYMNGEKFALNFCINRMPDLISKRVVVGVDGISFLRWSGLLINCQTLEVQADYTRYLANHLSSTLTICWQDKPGRQLKANLHNYMRLKCHPMFYDPDLNSPAIIRLNVYQAVLLCAMKFHCYVCGLSDVCKLLPRVYSSIIVKSLRFMYNVMRRRMHVMNHGSTRNPTLQMEKEEVLWLGLTAFFRALNRKQSRHKELLRLLRLKLMAIQHIGCSSELKYAVDDTHSSLLWKIKY